MSQKMIQYDEFKDIVHIMNFSPVKQGESENAYFDRIHGATQRSRTAMQLIRKASFAYPTDIESAYSEYVRLSKKRNEDKKKREEEKKQKTQQTEIDFGSDPQKPTVMDICPQEDVAIDNELKSDIEKAKLIAAYISRHPEILLMAIADIEEYAKISERFLEEWRTVK